VLAKGRGTDVGSVDDDDYGYGDPTILIDGARIMGRLGLLDEKQVRRRQLVVFYERKGLHAELEKRQGGDAASNGKLRMEGTVLTPSTNVRPSPRMSVLLCTNVRSSARILCSHCVWKVIIHYTHTLHIYCTYTAYTLHSHTAHTLHSHTARTIHCA
jgi:hypothetical protein